MEEIQTGSFGSRNPLKGDYTKIAKVVLGSALVIAAIAIGAYFIQSSKFATPKPKYYIPPHLTLNQQAQYLADHNQYQPAIQIYQQELASAKDTTTKLNTYFYMSALAMRFKDYGNAILYANEAKLIDSKSTTAYVALAQIYTAEGNKTSAKQYWQQAINHLDPNQPGYNLIKLDYENSIASLK